MPQHTAACEHFLISIVTPVLNEAQALPWRARELARQEPPWEWIVVDGESEDESARVAEQLGARLFRSKRGRGRQLNAGAALARGEALVFLHADTQLPAGALNAIRSALSNTEIVGGNFRMRFGAGRAMDRFLSACNRLRQDLFGTFFGDSVIFIRRTSFTRVDGCPQTPIMEDYELARRMRRLGPVVCLPLEVSTSDRRYRQRPLSTLFSWVAIYGLYRLGVSANLLVWLYPGPKGRSSPPKPA